MPSTKSESYEPVSPVPPGNITGYYIIIVAGLPWNTSWQTLKDFSKHLPDGTTVHIDHAMVYPNSTDGYVRVRGREDFRKVLQHLDGATLNNRSLLADGRNETKYLTLRPLDITKRQSCAIAQEPPPTQKFPLPPPPPPSQLANQNLYMQDCFGPPPPISQQNPIPQPAPSCYAFTSPDSSPAWNYPPQSTCGTFSPTSTVLSFSGVTCTPQPSPIFVAVNQLPHMIPSVALPSPYTMPMMPPPSPLTGYYQWKPAQSRPHQQVIRTEARKIIIKRLPRPTNEATLGMFLREVLPQEYLCVHNIEIARYGLNEPKGHAFVTFESIHAAQFAIDTLNGFKWRGKTLAVGIAKEGTVSPRIKPFRNYKTAPRDPRKHSSFQGRSSATPRSMTPMSSCSLAQSRHSVSSAALSTIYSRIPFVPSPTGFSDSSDPSTLELCAPPRAPATPAVVDGSFASQCLHHGRR